MATTEAEIAIALLTVANDTAKKTTASHRTARDPIVETVDATARNAIASIATGAGTPNMPKQAALGMTPTESSAAIGHISVARRQKSAGFARLKSVLRS